MVKRLASLTLIALAALVPVLAGFQPHPAAAQDPGTGPYTEQMRLGRGMVRSVAWSPDGSIIAVGGALGIWLYTPDLQDIGLLTGHTKAVYGLAFSPDGTRLASASHDQTVRIWDIASQKELARLEGHTDLVVTVAWSPDGQTIASGGYDNTIRLWSAQTGEAVGVLEGHSGWVDWVAWSPDGSMIASASYDDTVRLWDVATGDVRAVFPLQSNGLRALWSTDGDVVFSVESGQTTAWDVATGTSLASSSVEPEQKNYRCSCNYGPDDVTVAKADWDGTVQVWKTDPEADADELIAEHPEHMDWITAVSWNNDGSQITSAGSDNKVRTWDAATGELLEIAEGQMEAGPVTAKNPDGTRSARAGDDGTTITDTATREVIAFLPGPANAISWSPDGAGLAVALRNGTIKIWGEE